MIAARPWIRSAGRWLLRETWYRLRGLGVRLAPELLLRSPLDLKVGRHFAGPGSDRRMLVVCDFACISFSYDILKLLALADRRRAEAGYQWLDVAFVAHHDDPFPSPHAPANPIDRQNHRGYLHNLALEATKLIPATGHVLFFNDRPAFTAYWRRIKRSQPVFPDRYDPRRPNFEAADGAPLYGLIHLKKPDGSLHAPLTVPASDGALVRAWLAARVPPHAPVITITLRESALTPMRNSNISAWQALVDSYRDANVTFVVLQDHSRLYQGHTLTGPNVTDCPEAVLSLSVRAALYEQASLNMMVGNGPATLCYLNPRAKYIVTGIGADTQPNTDQWLRLLHGWRPGDQLVDGDPTRRLVWEPDRFEVLRRELDKALAGASKSSAA